MNFGDISSNTLNVPEGEFGQLLGMVRGNGGLGETHLSAGRIVVEIDGGALELTAEDGNIEVREID